MGRLIDVSELHNIVILNKSEWGIFATPIDRLIESLVSQVSTADAIPKAEYENRLKADLVAMLEELKKSIEDNVYNVSAYSECLDCDVIDYEDVNEIIIEKINALKAESEEI